MGNCMAFIQQRQQQQQLQQEQREQQEQQRQRRRELRRWSEADWKVEETSWAFMHEPKKLPPAGQVWVYSGFKIAANDRWIEVHWRAAPARPTPTAAETPPAGPAATAFAAEAAATSSTAAPASGMGA